MIKIRLVKHFQAFLATATKSCSTKDKRGMRDSINVHQITGNYQGTKQKHYDLESVDLSRPLKRRKLHRLS